MPSREADLTGRLPRVVDVLERGRAAGLHLGAQVCVWWRGAPVVDAGWGRAAADLPMTADTLTQWMSASKPVAALALGQLHDAGELEWTDPVVRFLPAFGRHGKEGITLEHLLTHTAGLRQADLGGPDAPWDDIVHRVCDLPLEPGWVPGQKAGYCVSATWYVLGEIVRRVAGSAYGDYVRQRIFEPLGLVESWFGLPRDRIAEYRAAGRIEVVHNTFGGTCTPQPWDTEAHLTRCDPGGGGRGPIRDLVTLYRLLLARGELHGVRLLHPDTVAELVRRRRVGMFDETFRHVLDWGLGFIVNSARYGVQTVPYGYGFHAARETFGHGGYQSVAAFADPQAELAVGVVFNGTPGEPRHNQRIRAFCTALYEDLGLAGGAQSAD